MTKDLSKYIPTNAAAESAFQLSKAKTDDVSYVPMPKSDDKDELDADFQEIRRRVASAHDIANEAVKEALELAKSSDHPGAWRVVGELIDALTKTNKALMDVHKERAKTKTEIRGKGKPVEAEKPKSQTNIQNNFYGSPSELASFLRGEKGDE